MKERKPETGDRRQETGMRWRKVKKLERERESRADEEATKKFTFSMNEMKHVGKAFLWFIFVVCPS